MPQCILMEQNRSSDSIKPISMTVTTAPTKTSYYAGQSFDPTGLVLEVTYGVKGMVVGTKTVYAGDAKLSYSPTTLTDGVTSVTINYVEDGAQVTTTTSVSVTHTLQSIAITTQPTTTTYEYGDSFSTAGMVVTATYSDGNTANVTSSCTVVPANGATLGTVGTQTVTVSYSDASVASAKTTSTSVTVTRKSVAKPTWKDSVPTYTGSTIDVANSTYWNNWNTTYFNYSGCSGVNAGSYTAAFTPTSNYCWSDGTISTVEVGWSIAKKAPTLSVTPTSIAINADNYSTGVAATITYDGDGTLSAVSSNSSIASVTGSGTANLTIKGNGSTAGSATITISATAGTNYSAATDVTISVTASYWSWGSETGTADATWWAGLQAEVKAGKAQSSWVGKTKSVTLTSAVEGTTTHLVRCIGVNQDGSNTVAFQTKNCLSIDRDFGYLPWSSSYARSSCINYYNAFPGKSYIKTVKKGTNTSYNTSSVTYTNETVWLPSIYEVGLGSYSYRPVGAEYTQGCSTPYSYYSSDTARQKNYYDGHNGSASWWTRSRSSIDPDYVCYVQGGGSGGTAMYDEYSGYRFAPAFVIG